MNNRIVNSAIVGVLLFVLGIVIQLLAQIEGLWMTISLITFLIVGIITAEPQLGFLVSFLMSNIFFFVTFLLFPPPNYGGDLSVALGLILFNVMISTIGGVVGSFGGFLGGFVEERMLKRGK